MRTPLSPVAKPRRCLSRSAANQAYSTQAAATITAVWQLAYQVSTVGEMKMRGTRNSSNQSRR